MRIIKEYTSSAKVEYSLYEVWGYYHISVYDFATYRQLWSDSYDRLDNALMAYDQYMSN